MLTTRRRVSSSTPQGTCWPPTRKSHSRKGSTPLKLSRKCRSLCLELCFYNGIYWTRMRGGKKSPHTMSELVFIFLIFSSVFTISTTSIAVGSRSRTAEMGLQLSLLENKHVVVSEDRYSITNSLNQPESYSDSDLEESEDEGRGEAINLDGFNLLWLVASKLESDDKLRNLSDSNNSPSFHYLVQSENTTLTNKGNEIYLNSAWPRSYLRYGKTDVPISRVRVSLPDQSSIVPPALSQTLSDFLDIPTETNHPDFDNELVIDRNLYESNVERLTRFITAKSIGFEMEFRVEENSSSGYIITGRSVIGQPYFTAVDSAQSDDDSLSEKQSWFGLYCLLKPNAKYTLRLEYRNAASTDKRPQDFDLVDDVAKGDWQKLAVTIDFDDNTINYWVNCSARRVKQLRANIDHPSSFYSVYRLLQHKRRSTLPVEVTFRSAVVTDGQHRTAPKQCEREQETVCDGGKIYMPCGPSCERTCEGMQSPKMTDKYLRTCAIACVSGCHCRPGYVTHEDVCVKPEQCPCLIGQVAYRPGQNATINNEQCSCADGQWHCFSPPRMTREPQNLTVIVKQSQQLVCAVSGNPLPNITWEVPEGSSHHIGTKDFGRVSILELRAVTNRESGIYKCRAQLPSTGWEHIATARVAVYSAPTIDLPSAIPVTSGHHVLSIDCGVKGLPAPSILWNRRGRIVTGSDRIHINTDAGTGLSRLKIHDVRRSDAGEWICRAENRAGNASKPVRILVRLPEPNNMAFSRKPVDQFVKRGHNAVFMCKFVNHPTAYNVTWLKDGVKINFTGKRIVTKSYRLVIRRVQTEDAGVYACVVRIRRGRELTAKAELMIKGRMLPWSEWSKCSVSCGKGIMFKRRTCTGVPPNMKTCHGDFARVKTCNTQVCPGTCSAYGDPHYTTFDGRRFDFHGECGYTLSEDAIGNDFKVLLYNADCGMGMNCLSRVTVLFAMRGLGAAVEIEKNGLVTINGVKTSLPYVTKDASLIVDRIGLYTIVNAGPDFELKWAIPHRLYLIVGPRYFNRMQGFCGNYNGDPNDDNLLRSGRPTASDHEFALNWAVRRGNSNRSCSAFLEPASDRCSEGSRLYERARDICGFLNNKQTFAHCNTKVPPERFIETCQYDICRTSMNKVSTYFCTASSAYAEECLRNGVVLNWRKDDFCPETCVGGQVYEECGPRCARYCPGIANDSGTVCSSNEACVSGCHCPRQLVLRNGRCIEPRRCPCVHRGREYAANSTLNKNCEKCTCNSGRWQCVFNKALCEFPSSVIKGPLPQVVPLGRSVSFCCEVAGIPTPTVEWYRDGRAVPPQTDVDLQSLLRTDGVPETGYVKSYYYIANLTKQDEGPYYCKATNRLGSQASETVSLTVVDPWMATCNPVPSKRVISLPAGCLYSGETELNVGHCPSLPCFYNEPVTVSQRLRKKDRCGGTKQCCRPSRLQPVLVRCSTVGTGRAFPLYITTITKCSCSICESRYTIIEGALLTSTSGDSEKLLSDVKIDYQGRVVGYTSKTGSFNLKLLSLPEEARYISLTFTDIMHKRFPVTVKNLPVIVGETTTHKVLINGHGLKISFDASAGLRKQFRSSISRNNDRLRIVIPPRSVILQQAVQPYIGRVEAIISIVEKNYEHDRSKLDAIPGDFVGVDRRGNKQILQPAYVVSVSLFSQYGRALELLPDRSATFLVSTVSLGDRMQPWVLDELTGLWRERDTKVIMRPNFNKRREKILQLIAKIPRLNTAWALSDSEDACYVRVRALDKDNNTVAGVRFVMTTTAEIPRRNSRSRRTSSNTAQLSTVVESLTRSSDTNGICLPIGCAKFGFISAAKLANELSPLLPDQPLPELGSVTTHQTPGYSVPKPVIQTINIDSMNNINRRDADTRTATLYYPSENLCKTTVADRRTYVFRDNSQDEIEGYEEASRKAALRAVTRVAPTRPTARPARRPGLARRFRSYCHVKVAVSLPVSRGHVGNLMAVLAATFGERDSSGRRSTIGWRRTSFRTPVSRRSTPSESRRVIRYRPRRIVREVCVEYLCGEPNPAAMAYVAIKPLKGSAVSPLQCRFVNTTSSRTTPASRPIDDTRTGGYVTMSPRIYRGAGTSSRFSRTRRVYPQLAFQDRTLLLSKKKCIRARGTKYTAASIRCV